MTGRYACSYLRTRVSTPLTFMPETTLALARTLLDSAVLAFSATLVLLLIVEAAFYVHVRLPRRSIFAHNLLNRPGADLRSRRIKLRGRLYLYSFASLMFLLTFAVILIGHPDPFVRSLPAWAQITVGLLVLMGILHLIVRAVVIKLALRDVQNGIDAFGSLGEVLGRISSRGYRVFYSLPGRGSVIDAIVIGSNGVFAVMVALGSASAGQRQSVDRVEFDGKRITINGKPGRAIVARAKDNSSWLQERLGRVIGHSVVVRTLIVVPGADVRAKSSEDCLVVPEDRLTVLSGWTRKDAYLMEDDIERITRWLEQNCRESTLKDFQKRRDPGRRLPRRESGATA